jgi:hypothetical protein
MVYELPVNENSGHRQGKNCWANYQENRNQI